MLNAILTVAESIATLLFAILSVPSLFMLWKLDALSKRGIRFFRFWGFSAAIAAAIHILALVCGHIEPSVISIAYPVILILISILGLQLPRWVSSITSKEFH